MRVPPRLRIQIRNKLALEPLDQILEHQPAFLEAPQHDVIDLRVLAEVIDDVIQIPVLDAEISEPAGVLKRRRINILVHPPSVSGIAQF